ncbi:MAG: hypothetical protein HYX78_14660 [Armatimonadetes bacterium]|nr:hypothetical protein [Armatimonadota bacterium]
MTKEEIIAELRRVANIIQTQQVTKRQFKLHGKMSTSTVDHTFGSWNEAIVAAGLIPTPMSQLPTEVGMRRLPDNDLLQEIVRLTSELGQRPTTLQFSARRKISLDTYRRRWGSWRAACGAAYAKFGCPVPGADADLGEPTQVDKPVPVPEDTVTETSSAHSPGIWQRRKKVVFGEPIEFRGMRFAPINEQGVVYLFGIVSRELDFLIESVRTSYPDCEGKRCVDKDGRRWEHVLVEFEYQSSNFRDHGHSPDEKP